MRIDKEDMSKPGGGEAEPEDLQRFYVTDDDTGMVIAGAFVLASGGTFDSGRAARVSIGCKASDSGAHFGRFKYSSDNLTR